MRAAGRGGQPGDRHLLGREIVQLAVGLDIEMVVVPGAGLRDAGKQVSRRFTDVYRRENGIWRHDMRHANVIKVE